MSPVLAFAKIIFNIVQKANLFNDNFYSQCIPSENKSKVPLLFKNTDKRLKIVSYKKDDINSIIKFSNNSFNPTKTNQADNISVRMIQL